ncbi:MAG: ribonuclease P protein component [Acidaminococcaceae bacterium]|nr:ribonuclease P protein component [Acidaminococcaceae bacterium]MDO4935225.1 ribonuclease P protein component [Phascolarctobacterium sp.]
MHNFSFPKQNKLKKKKHFQFVYQRGKAHANLFGAIYVMKGEGLQIGLAVGKKLGHAVVRNHIKRMMREAFRLHHEQIKPGYHLIWVARYKLVHAGLANFEMTLLTLCREAGILIESENG